MRRYASRWAWIVAASAVLAAGRAEAHPHALPAVRADVIFNTQGRVSALRYEWTYDSAYSSYVVRDIDKNKDGVMSPDELEQFARVQVEALAERSYFTAVAEDSGSLVLGPAQPFGIEKLGDGRLRLTFVAPLKTAISADKPLTFELHDPEFFAYFVLAKDGVRLENAPANCASAAQGPQPLDFANTRSIPAVFWEALDGSKAAGRQFVSRITVTCQ